MFDNLSNLFSKTVGSILADRAIAIPQNSINAALSVMVITIPELSALSMEIHDGNFDLLVEGKKVISFKARVRFEITSCEISSEKQKIVFKRISPTEMTADGLINRILLTVFMAIICQIFNIEPANLVLKGQSWIAVDGDNYIVDLAKTALSAQITPQIETALNIAGSFMHIKGLRCMAEKIEVMIGR
ncbi:hypothetical protein [Ferrovum myxofaciens]|uniref:hypothetical protein n=1 Tax=Ferrovum myxofaciens TaxID=416213 RepID=UPI0004E2013F|nr:hypothetical protein [Ferrovum myxofaciens]